MKGLFENLLLSLEDKLRSQDILNVKEYIAYGEYGIALETICDQLIEYNESISLNEFNLIKRLFKIMDMEYEMLGSLRVIER